MASAKLENKLVSHRITAIARMKPLPVKPSEMPHSDSTKRMEVRIAERIDQKHNGVLDLLTGRELYEGIADGAPHHSLIHEGLLFI